MGDVDGSRTFGVPAESYDGFMGRYSRPLAGLVADLAGVRPGDTALDVGCGPGALTEVLVDRLGVDAVAACDPAPGFVAECARRHPGVRVELGRAESIPFETGSFDHAFAQLVLHFVAEPERAASEMMRVVRSSGCVSACVWDFDDGMELLRRFWDAALAIDPDAPDEARTLRFGREGEIAELFAAAGMHDVSETTLSVSSTYSDVDELWRSFLAGVGPAGSYCLSLDADRRARLREALVEGLGRPTGPITLGAVARSASGRTPE